ncbi:TIM barrel protein [Paenibacillus sp. sptzw28]|uniref:sugar phosphate isomerase/epimerase family protein n=1 Tax=Paenibacillus sp. sptzw28 TaxID=715179 RepID=UPI001C6DF28E|nr:TIM barrel protein [Paenibacillus sp. sptzw28]QYR21794.1 TIM barrel protein [Paenibacillus sp. sptzw28]
MTSPVFVAASVYGSELVKKYGQPYFAALAARTGASGFEIRRELFPAGVLPFDELRNALKENGLRAAISASVEIWSPEGELNRKELSQTLLEGARLGVSFVKTTLGTYIPGKSDLKALKSCLHEALADLPIHLAVENDQTNHGGNAQILRGFLDDCAKAEIPIRMTFDVGNWIWAGEDIVKAADTLAEYVVYVHFKWAAERNGRLLAAPLADEADAEWRQVLSHFPKELPRVIEFPITADDLEGSTRHYVQLLSQA